MTKKYFLLVALPALFAAGCYSSSNHEGDAGDGAADPARDDGSGQDVRPDVIIDPYPDVPIDILPDQQLCTSTVECPDNYFCDFPAGRCVGPGVCLYRGDGICPTIYAPVCGCDNMTYGNDCARIYAGVSLSYTGECGVAPCYPGDPYGVCGAGFFCEGPQGVCDLEGPTGWCEPIPMGCFDLWDPVCGCGGVTFPNDCERQVAGVWLDHRGDCERVCQPGDPYGDCSEGEICEGHEGLCDVMGVAGWCQTPDTSCGYLYDPVCGCNDVTYSNDCERQAAGVWRDHWGPCGSTPVQPCGRTLPACPDGAFCDYPSGDCGIFGLNGACVVFPYMCPEYYSPVCGCDSRTYDNDCFRQAAGVSQCYPGPCGPEGCVLE
jgi:hypothetical protein